MNRTQRFRAAYRRYREAQDAWRGAVQHLVKLGSRVVYSHGEYMRSGTVEWVSWCRIGILTENGAKTSINAYRIERIIDAVPKQPEKEGR